MALGRLSTPSGAVSGPPEFKVPAMENRFIESLLFTHATTCDDPGGTCGTRHFAPFIAGFSITLLDLLPHVAISGLH
jgi:hypothetical protein